MATSKRIRVGERLTGIPADTWNGFADVVDRFRDALPPLLPRNGSEDTFGPVVEIKNNSGANVNRGGVLAIAGPRQTTNLAVESLNLPSVNGVAPNESAYGRDSVAIMLEQIVSGAVGKAVVAGVAWAIVNVTDVNHTHARPSNGVIIGLVSDTEGFKLLSKNGTGIQWCLVLIDRSSAATPISVHERANPIFYDTGWLWNSNQLPISDPGTPGTANTGYPRWGDTSLGAASDVGLYFRLTSEDYAHKIDVLEGGIFDITASVRFSMATPTNYFAIIGSPPDYRTATAIVSLGLQSGDDIASNILTSPDRYIVGSDVVTFVENQAGTEAGGSTITGTPRINALIEVEAGQVILFLLGATWQGRLWGPTTPDEDQFTMYMHTGLLSIKKIR